MNSRVPEPFDGYTLQYESNEAGDKATKEEYTDEPDRPAKVSTRKDTPVEEENPDFDDCFRNYPGKQ